MVFTSIQAYQQDLVDWQRQPSGGTSQNNVNLLPPSVSSSGGAVRPSDLISDRARVTKLPQQDELIALNCPRCDSTNTKFCYFNNYSLTQPRHFCKTCRRYWTRGGALRNVPVGGSCRRNKRSKGSSSDASSRSKSPVTNTIGSISSTSISTSSMLGHLVPPPLGQLPFYPSLRNLNNFRGGDNIRLSFGGGGSGPIFATEEMQHLPMLPHMQQFHFSSAEMLDEPQPGLYEYNQIIQGGVDQSSSYIGESGQLKSNSKQPLLNFGVTTTTTTNMYNVKNEENQGMDLPRSFLGVQQNVQYWRSANANNSNAWTDLPGFTSSSTSHLL